MNFNSNPILYPKDDGLKPTKDNGLNPPCYPKEDGLNPFKAIVERINALESVTRNYGDSFETKQLNVSENAQIENLNATEGTVNTLNSTNATVTNLNSTNATVNTLNSTNGNIKNAEVENINATEGTVDTLKSTTSTITNLNATTSTITNANVTNATVENAEVKKLNVTENAQIENAQVKKLHATEEIKVENLKTEEPILSNAVVGFNENGKMIPIRIVAPTESSLYFDYTVDSQQKFDDLLSILKSGTPSTYRSIAILGGFGGGEHGEYLYTVDSNSGEANFNNASFIGFNNPKIVITANDADTFKVFKNGVIKDIDFNVGGTVITDETVTLFHNCTYDNGKIALNNVSANFNIVNTTLSNVVNDECKSFSECTLNDCTNNAETIFTSCNLNKGSVTDSCTFTSCKLNDYTINGNCTFTSCNFTDGSINGICSFTSCKLNNILIDYACTFTSSTLKDCKNTKYSTFTECSLNFCNTVQSVFNKCNSEMLYVSTDTNIANKYSFDKCGIHLDMKKVDMTQLETVTINIASMTDSRLSVLDTSSNLKKIILNVDASDSLSEIVGNNDKKYSIYEPFVKRVSKSVSPSMRNKAYLCYYDESHTPIFSDDGIAFYLDEAMTQKIKCYSITNSNNERIWTFSLENDDTHIYSSLTFNKEITYTQRDGESVASVKLSDYGDEFILNGNPLKTYICRNDEGGTLLYSNDNGTNIYISPYINDDNKVQFANPNTDSKLFMVGQFSYLTKNLGAFNVRPSFSNLNFATPQLLEVTASKDNYAVQVVSNYDVPIYVENAFSTKIKNG